MSAHAISDDEILAYWDGATWLDERSRKEIAGTWRARIEAEDTESAICKTTAALRDRLGGWDRVWLSVLVDCGAERREDYLAMRVWQVKVAQRAKLYVTRDAVGRWSGHVAGRRLNFASPADLRERVKAAERLFRG